MEVAKEYQAKNAHKMNKKEDKTDKQAKSLRELLAEV
jgi:hypothetical protein